jgi:hypothetical protein
MLSALLADASTESGGKTVSTQAQNTTWQLSTLRIVTCVGPVPTVLRPGISVTWFQLGPSTLPWH